MRTPQAPLVTVVTVVHNGETHLQECINSVLAQTYDNWEYVLVDNCSTDRTAEIAKEAAATDRRIRHERHDNFVDVVSSHNRGFQAVGRDSRYCKFVGADDWLFPGCLARMVQLAEREPKVGVVSSYRLNGDRVDLVNLEYGQTSVAGREIVARSLSSSSSLVGSPTAVLLRAELVRERQPFFDETFRHADSDAAYWTLMRADYGFVHQVLTYNRSSLETNTSDRLASYGVERLRLLVRYGTDVLTREAYTALLRSQLDAYVEWHRKLFIWRQTKGRLTRFRERDETREEKRVAFHRTEIELLAEEAAGDEDVQRAIRRVRFYLRRA